MRPSLALFILAGTNLCFGNETIFPAWNLAFFTDRIQLRLAPPADPAVSLRWSAEGIVPRPSAPSWQTPLSFAESTTFCARLYRGREGAGDPVTLSLVQANAATPDMTVANGLWVRSLEGHWTSTSEKVTMPPGSRADGVLRVTRAGLVSLAWSESLDVVRLGEFSFTGPTEAAAPFWIEPGDYPLSAETRSAATGPATLSFQPIGGGPEAVEFRRTSAAPVPFATWAPGQTAGDQALDGRRNTAWSVPTGPAAQNWILTFPIPLQDGAIIIETGSSLRELPGQILRADGQSAKAVLLSPGRFRFNLHGTTPNLTLVQPAQAPSWTFCEIERILPDLRPASQLAVNVLPGDDPSSLPGLTKLTELTIAIWPRLAEAARTEPRHAVRQLWVDAVVSKGEPAKIIGRHLLIGRETLESLATRGLLVGKLGELAARASAKSPADVSRGLGAGLVTLALSPDLSLPSGGTFALPAEARALAICRSARENPAAFFSFLEKVRSGWDVSMWKDFEEAQAPQAVKPVSSEPASTTR